ncbi:hypothetical protein ANCDUO_17443 [Ancylostoma duodenale]|uniref:DNA/RNA-binding protein Alba-like domain-containing protein n=1 Tax=Ancylostoma duodenale TaxID=51022 RepID=A0A0C2G5W3_9BILA|nr:hypothetical protein ANCDUO_17443 [Ancylostoma duodenale]
MELRKNTKFGNIIDFVNKMFEDETVRRVIFRGVGDAAEKCISCVEVFKRKRQEELYQWNALSTAKRVTYWDPVVPGMNRLKVTIDTPVIFIMLSRDPYPVELQCMSMQRSSDTGMKMHAKSAETRSSRRGGRRKERGSNKWSRPLRRQRIKKQVKGRRLLRSWRSCHENVFYYIDIQEL